MVLHEFLGRTSLHGWGFLRNEIEDRLDRAGKLFSRGFWIMVLIASHCAAIYAFVKTTNEFQVNCKDWMIVEGS